MTGSKRNNRSSRAKPQLRARTTRSRGKPLSDPATNTAELNSQLLAMGLYAAPTIGDGNCLFRALSDQLYGSDYFHHKLRKDVCDWIESHKGRYEPFVEDERGIETHLRCMRENATYGGHMELSAFAHLTRRNVKVIQPGLVYVVEWDAGWDSDPLDDQHVLPTASTSSPSRPKRDKQKTRSMSSSAIIEEAALDATIYVAYHDWEHFSSIRNVRGPHAGLPLIQEMPAPSVDDADEDEEIVEKPRKLKPYSKSNKPKSKSKRLTPAPTTELSTSASSLTTLSAATSTDTTKGKLPTIKLRISRPTAPTPSSSYSSLSSLSSLPSTVNGSSRPASTAPPSRSDPQQIPLPTSRSPSPTHSYASSSAASLPQIHSRVSALASVGASGSASTPSLPTASLHHHHNQHDRPLTPQQAKLVEGQLHHHHRSPKRTFDESSVSSEASSSSKRTKTDHTQLPPSRLSSSTSPPPSSLQRTTVHGPDEEGVEQTPRCTSSSFPGRSRKIVVDLTEDELSELSECESDLDAEGDPDPDVIPPGTGCMDIDPAHSPASAASHSTPSLSYSQSSSSSSTSSSALSSAASSTCPTPEPTITIKTSRSSKPSSRASTTSAVSSVSSPKTVRTAPVKPLTRRQRKALGLPKKGNGSGADTGTVRRSAGKIIIPGGKFKRPGAEAAVTAMGTGDEEWRRNGTGRVDVRGFRELKI